MPSYVKSVVPYPEVEGDLLSTVRDVVSKDSFVELVIRKGEPIQVTTMEETEDGKSVDISPWDLVRMTPLVELVDYPDSESARDVLIEGLKQVSKSGVWPICILVHDTTLFLKSLGRSDLDILYYPKVVLGYPVIGDVRVEPDVLVIPCTSKWQDGYGLISSGLLAHYDTERGSDEKDR